MTEIALLERTIDVDGHEFAPPHLWGEVFGPAAARMAQLMLIAGRPRDALVCLRRLERDSLIRSRWEKQSIADAEQRPPRKYYTLTTSGRATLEAAQKRYPLLVKLIPAVVGQNA